MYEPFDIKHSTGNYSVLIDSGSFSRNIDRTDVLIITDRYFAHIIDMRPGLSIPATEKTKSLEECAHLVEVIRRCGATRQTTLLAIGGGVIQDTVAFISSIYMRGIPYIYMPTTLLAMVDSCIGGKSSINVGPHKNLVGTFHPPKQVIIDPALIATLPAVARISGTIEAAKIAYVHGEECFDRYLSFYSSQDFSGLIHHSLQAKKYFIEHDEFDRGDRLLLNLGHTFGHAIESASGFTITHGIAVGLGILCAIEYSGVHSPRVTRLKQHMLELLSSVSIPPLNPLVVMEHFQSDKKHSKEYFTMILFDHMGDVFSRRAERNPEIIHHLEQVVATVIECYHNFTNDYLSVASVGL